MPTPNTLPKPAVLAVGAALLALAGCVGGGGGNSPDSATASSGSQDPTPIPSLAISGKVMNVGYVANATVCLDDNDNRQCDAGEPTAVTDTGGNYSLTVPAGSRGAHLLAQLRPASTDSGYTRTAADGNPIQQGWTLAAVLEYAPGATAVSAHISPLTFTYLTRLFDNGRNRLSNKNTVLIRAGKTGTTAADYATAIDFDYVASPPAGLADKLKGLTDYLAARAAAKGSPSAMLDTAAVLRSWYATYSSTTTPIMDASRIDPLTGTNTVATGVTNYITDGRYFRTRVAAATVLRDGVGDVQETARSGNALDRVLFASWKLVSGAAAFVWEKWQGNAWSEAAQARGSDAYLTFDGNGALKSVTAADSLGLHTLATADGNLAVLRLPVSNVRYSFVPTTDIGRNYYINGGGWFNQMLNGTKYAYTTSPFSKPACAASATDPAKQTAADWYSACQAYYRDEFVTNNGGNNVVLDNTNTALSVYSDFTFLDQFVKIPLVSLASTPLYTDCASAGRATVTVAGVSTCNWLVDAGTGHTLDELFAGLQIESQTQKDGNGAIRKLTLTLNQDGSATLSGIAARTVTAAGITSGVTEVTETLQWERHPKNANAVLLRWPDVAANNYALYPHFSLTDGARSFATTPGTYSTTSASPNPARVAIVLQEGVFMAGMAYDAGWAHNERNVNQPMLEKTGIPALNYVIGKLYAAGFQ